MNWNDVRNEVSRIARGVSDNGKQIDTMYLGRKQMEALLRDPECRYYQFQPYPHEMTTVEGVNIIQTYADDHVGIGYNVTTPTPDIREGE